MPFPESIKASVRRRAHFTCCLCKTLGVDIHHILPQEEGGPDTEDNAAPLCPSCHGTYGANPVKRKFIGEARDLWFEICEARYGSDAGRLDEIDRVLKSLEGHVKTAAQPLLPFALFYTLRHTTTEQAIRRAFGQRPGYRAPKNEFLQLVGTATLGGYGMYNRIEFRPEHSHCTMPESDLEALIQEHSGFGESVIKGANNTDVEFFFDRKSASPALTLKMVKGGDGKPHEVNSLELFDDTVFQGVFVSRWEAKNTSKRTWGVTDLEGSRIRIRIKTMSYDDINLRQPMRLHNLHLYFGREMPHILFFKSEQLAFPVVMEDPDPVARWDFSAIGMTAREMLLVYEFDIDEAMIATQLKQIV
jgi:hypothetical protein